MRSLKMLLLKPPLDDHDRPIYELIPYLREHNVDVIWVGLQQPWSQITKTIMEEDVDAVGVSVHAGDPVILLGIPKQKMEEIGLYDRIFVAGGSGEITFPEVREKLENMGYKVFLSGTGDLEVADYILGKFKEDEKLIKTIAEHYKDELSSNLLAKHITRLEKEPERFVPKPRARAFRIVVSGPSGGGKSSILNKVLEKVDQQSRKVGVMLCDPRGPQQKGAFLGDRICMQDRTSSENIFIRSFSQLGNYSEETISFLKKVSDLFSLWDANLIFLETVGMGQYTEVKLKELADLFIWVALPGETDPQRLLKGGIHELADVILLNKIDLAPTFRAEHALQQHFKGPYFKTSALTGEGIDGVCEFILEKIKKPLS